MLCCTMIDGVIYELSSLSLALTELIKLTDLNPRLCLGILLLVDC